ncbi:hypothetical protein Taro_048478 [Colocasia esculenta]|uniref:Uncharacterized protein n=1 Tax=Colocasia esculenta TaxID=4460 RepID=A0A843X884_COLES|nr:hypothetical protein [Colocasia esculenta]
MSNSFMKLLTGDDIDRIIDMHEILRQKLINNDVNVSGSEEIDAKCDFFMWCDEVQNFVDSQITCGKDENVLSLENRVARLEDERRDLNCIVNKTKMVVKVLPETFSVLNIVDGDDGSDND